MYLHMPYSYIMQFSIKLLVFASLLFYLSAIHFHFYTFHLCAYFYCPALVFHFTINKT